ncbi:aquaporin-9-like isoform X3 [Limulus polyphemus]|uniref:Aquaporin-9-like isoform X3 n=1 Tax=Limulus polyphemus TaxID=6850 RepID=A0ABM1S9K4_LIMPO|nr:aquaporin-9-like isoform X3 [Limulus polyphemus]
MHLHLPTTAVRKPVKASLKKFSSNTNLGKKVRRRNDLRLRVDGSTLFGDAAFAQTVLEGRGVSDVFAVVFAWGVGVMMGLATSMGVSGGHINPAVTTAFASLGKFPWRKVPHYLAAQHLGGFLASAVVYFTYIDALNWFDGGNRTIVGETGTGYIWATYPKEYVSIPNCFLDQIVGTGILMFTVVAVIDQRNVKFPLWGAAIAIGFMIAALAMCFGANCMAALNPARDFATRVFTAVAGWGSAPFSVRNYNYWWIGVVGPHLGAIIGGWLYYLGVELHWPDEDEEATDKELKELLDRDKQTNGKKKEKTAV